MAKNKPSVPNTSVPGAGGVPGTGGIGNPDCPAGGASEGCPLQQCTITTQTEHTQPPDRSRKKIGVGERVTLSVDPSPATWSVDTGGTLSAESGASS